MYELPPILIDLGCHQVNLRVRCKPLDLLRIFALQSARSMAVANLPSYSPSDRCAADEAIARCIVCSPELLLFASAHYFWQVGQPIPTFDDLIDWLINRGGQAVFRQLDTMFSAGENRNNKIDNSQNSTLDLIVGQSKAAKAERYRKAGPTPTGKKIRRALVKILSGRPDRILFGLVVDRLFYPASVAAPETSLCFFRWKRQSLNRTSPSDSSRDCQDLIEKRRVRLGSIMLPQEDCTVLIDTLQRSAAMAADFHQKLHVEKMAALKQLAYGASHEINNPLANISTRAQVLIVDETHPERRAKLSAIYEQAMRAHEMISDLMLFANPPAMEPVVFRLRPWLANLNQQILNSYHDFDPSPASERLNQYALAAAVSGNGNGNGHGNGHGNGNGHTTSLINDSSSNFSFHQFGNLSRFQHSFRITIAAGIDTIYGDPLQLAVAVKALVRNAHESIQALTQTAEVSLRIDRGVSDQILISVTDNGPGISQDTARHLFDPFFSGREAGRGLGFGLSKVWRIAELHSGRINWNSVPGRLTSFTIAIPSNHSLEFVGGE